MNTRIVLALLAAASVAPADDAANAQAVGLMREFTFMVAGRTSDDIGSIQSRLTPIMQKITGRTQKSVYSYLRRSYQKKYKKSTEFLNGVSVILASGGQRGIATVFRQYKSEKKRDGIRLGIVSALANCGDDRALGTLRKIVHDKEPEVAAAAIRGCGKYAKVDEKARKETAKELIALYKKTESQAAGKGRTTKERIRLDTLKSAFLESLTAFCGCETFTNAEAWDAWLRENLTKPWPKQ